MQNKKPFFGYKPALVERFCLYMKRLSFTNSRVIARLNADRFKSWYSLVVSRMANQTSLFLELNL